MNVRRQDITYHVKIWFTGQDSNLGLLYAVKADVITTTPQGYQSECTGNSNVDNIYRYRLIVKL